MPIRTNLAVIILNYFGSGDTLACVTSVRENAPGCAFYLVDNSADPSEQEQINDLFKDSSDVELRFPTENLGFAAGVNLALQAAVNDGFNRFLVLNNDATLLENSGPILDRALQKHTASIIAPAIIWDNEICHGGYYHRYLGLITGKPLWKSNNFLFYLTGCAIAFDKTALDKIGYLDESFFMYGEDTEYSNRARKNNVPTVILADQLVEHVGSKSSRQGSFFYEYHVSKSHFNLTFRLFDCLPCSIFALFVKTFTMTSRAIYRTFKNRSFAPLAALFLAPFPIRVRPNRGK